MRKISITSEIEELVKEEYAKAIKDSSFHQKIVDELTALKNEFLAAHIIKINSGTPQKPNWDVSPSTSKQYSDYVDEIIQDYNSGVLLTWQPKAFCSAIAHKDTLVNHEIVNRGMIVGLGTDKNSLANRLVKAMHYSNVRDEIVPAIYRKLELKTCVYCNANYTISDNNGEGYFDLDHWKPKSFYPFLCISFFNLQPSCPSCNRRKSFSDNPFFGLWDDTRSVDLDVLRFHLDERSIVDYLVFLERGVLKVDLWEADPWNSAHHEIRENTEKHLHIEARYTEHNDYTEEIVWKSKIYNPSMIQSLRESQFSSLIPNQAALKRFILGTYSNLDDIHRRPLTRLSIDVAKQLGMWG